MVTTRPPGKATDADVHAAQRKDENAFRRLYRDVQPRLLRYLRTFPTIDTDDLAAETWLHIIRDLDSFTGGIAAFRAWAATIARNRTTDHLRRCHRHPTADVRADELTHLPAPDDPEETVLARLVTTRTLRLIATLPADQADAITLRVIFDLDAPNAARILGKRPGAVRSAAHRGLRALAQRLEQERPHIPPDRRHPTRTLPSEPRPA